MDFIRASIKALFFDFPVENAVRIVTTNNSTLTGEFTRLVNARERNFGTAGMEALKQKLCNEWMGHNSEGDGIVEILDSLRLPYLYAEKALDLQTNGRPVVQFENLFRWNEMSRIIGEDIMTLCYVARKDVEADIWRNDLTWSNVLSHNDAELNKELHRAGRSLCDIHMHLSASTDIFTFSWTSLMNNIRGRKEAFAQLIHPLDSPIVVTKRYDYDNLYRWCVLAAMIRWELFKYYGRGDSKTFGSQFESDFKSIASQIPFYFRYELRDLQGLLTEAGKISELTSDDKVYDYALNEVSLVNVSKESPYTIYQGERFLLYQFYRDYWSHADKVRTIGKFVYLYELIKNQLRRELNLVNDLYGLGNFQEYNRRKGKLVTTNMGLISRKFAVQSALEYPQDGMEARISPLKSATAYKRFYSQHYNESIFGKSTLMTEASLRQRLTFVVHFLKTASDGNNRYSALRSNLHRQATILMEKLYKEEKQKNIRHRIIGIDVAGNETSCRPEVFAHLYRYCRKVGMENFTYHVGEDFYDLTDGLRSIDEAVRFLGITKGNRLGHCMAMGIDAKRYYQRRHRTVVMPKQILLDNLVWLLKKVDDYQFSMDKAMRETLSSTMIKLYGEIGYDVTFDLNCYYRSMLLRGDDIVKYRKQNSDWLTTALDKTTEAEEARKDCMAVRLWDEYFNSKEVYQNGFLSSVEFKVPYLYEKLIKKLQNKMIRRIRNLGICVEVNPTSNIRIGRLESYQEHPLYRFSKVRKRPDQNMIVTVNTDDKGIFTTSLYREFSLVALALMKQKKKGKINCWSDEEVRGFVGKLADNGERNRFR